MVSKTDIKTDISVVPKHSSYIILLTLILALAQVQIHSIINKGEMY